MDKYHILISRVALPPINLTAENEISKNEIEHLYNKGYFENAIAISIVKIKYL